MYYNVFSTHFRYCNMDSRKARGVGIAPLISEPPIRRSLFGRCGGYLLLLSLSNAFIGYGGRYLDGWHTVP